MSRHVVFRVAAGTLIAASLAHVGTALPGVLELATDVPAAAAWVVGGYVVCALTAVLACLLAAFLLWKASDRAAGRPLILFLGFLAVFWGSLFRFVDLTWEGDTLSAGITYGSGWVSQSALAALILAAISFVRFSAVFPRPLTADRLPPPRWRFMRAVREAMLKPAPTWGAGIVLFLIIRLVPEIIGRTLGERASESDAAMFLVQTNLILMAAGFLVFPLACVITGLVNLRSSYRLADASERRRMTWVMAGFSGAAWLVLAAVATGLVVGTLDVPERIALAIPVLFGLAPLLVVLGSAAGVLYSGAIHPGLALQRSTVWGILAAVAVTVFAGLENALSALVEQRLGLPGFTGSMVAGALVAAVLVPVRRPVQRWVTGRLAHPAESGQAVERS